MLQKKRGYWRNLIRVIFCGDVSYGRSKTQSWGAFICRWHFYSDVIGKMHGGFDGFVMNRTVERREETLSIWQLANLGAGQRVSWNVCAFCNFSESREGEQVDFVV